MGQARRTGGVATALRFATAGALAVAAMLPAGCVLEGIGTPYYGSTETQLMDAHRWFYAALEQNCAGNPQYMPGRWAHTSEVSDLSPDGVMHVGWPAVEAQFLRESKMGMGGKFTWEQLSMIVGDDWGVTSCIEVGHGMMIDGKRVDMRYRATNVFRREDDGWVMVHHHAEPMGAVKVTGEE